MMITDYSLRYGKGAAAVVLALTCLSPKVWADSETRSVEAFHAIAFHGSWSVDVNVGKESSVVIEGDKDSIAKVKTEVVDGELRVGLERDASSLFGIGRDIGKLTAHIALPQLDALAFAGSGNVSVTGFNGGATSFALDGSGDLKADGHVDKLNLAVNGSGSAHLASLIVEEAKTVINGSGDVVLQPRQSLDAAINGSGRIEYIGQPAHLNTAIHGSGAIEKH